MVEKKDETQQESKQEEKEAKLKQQQGQKEKIEGEAKQEEEKKQEKREEKKEEKKEELKLSKKIKDIIDSVEKLSVLELSGLIKALEEKFGVSAQAFATVAGAIPQAAAGDAAAEEKSTFDVILAATGDKKIQVIKEIRVLTQLGLKEAKDLADKAPQPIKEGVLKEEAEKIKKQLEEQGATIELK
jgi:large subunit ribosomal protein L7/L12